MNFDDDWMRAPGTGGRDGAKSKKAYPLAVLRWRGVWGVVRRGTNGRESGL